jgi:hypothetical protein
MARFNPFDANVEVSGNAVLSVIDAFPAFLQPMAINVLNHKGIVDPQPDQWYPQASLLEVFSDIGIKFGEHTLFEMGKAFYGRFHINRDNLTLQSALELLSIVFEQNHRGGNAGYYQLNSFDAINHCAVLVAKNPYPCDFDRGLVSALARNFIPQGALFIEVMVDKDKPCRKKGATESWYNISW